jgi:predicted CXXCH cytochrome family protein
MSKLKLGFSAVFMFILISMFGAVAFAQQNVQPVVPADEFTPTTTHPTQTGILDKDGNSKGIYVGDIDNQGDQNTHRTHGNFQNNTGSCANCHSAHNGENEQLLMKSTEYDLCMACHDGTMGFYNVAKGSEAGVFNTSVNAADHSASMHNVDSVAISAAPGAIKTNGTSDVAEFECSSCHNPHGSVNDRLLNETVAGKVYANTYDVTIVGYTETIVKHPLAKGNSAIKLNLALDDTYKNLNDITGTKGLKIYKSNGIYAAPDAGKGVTQQNVYDWRLNYSEFCSGCHDAYLANREAGKRLASDAEGVGGVDHFTHTTSSTKAGRACVSCHYAHGTDDTILMDTAGKKLDALTTKFAGDQAKAEAYIKDVSVRGSSLKRFTNNAVCYACHKTTHAIDTPAVEGSDFSGKTLIK